jgi:hypothetical protein
MVISIHLPPPVMIDSAADRALVTHMFATIVEDRIRELAALDRYERRAISKRKSAIRAFDCTMK